MGKLRDTYTKRLIDFLGKEGERLINECLNEITYNHDTLNLADSYGYGVYLRGKLVRNGYALKAARATEPRVLFGHEVWGRKRIEEFLYNEYKARGYVDLVLAAAMPYGYDLEHPRSGRKKKYRVISMSYWKLKDLSSKIKGSSVFHISNSTISN